MPSLSRRVVLALPLGRQAQAQPAACPPDSAIARRTSCSSWPTTSAMPIRPATAVRTSTPPTSTASLRRAPASPGLRQLRGLLGDPHGAHHRALPVPPARRAGGADRGQLAECRPAARSADAARAAAAGRLRHQAAGQVAPRHPAGFQPAQKRLRPLLRLSWRRAGRRLPGDPPPHHRAHGPAGRARAAGARRP